MQKIKDIQDRTSTKHASKDSWPCLSLCFKGKWIWVSSAYKLNDITCALKNRT